MVPVTVSCGTIEGVDWQDLSASTFTEKLAVFRLHVASNALIPSDVYAILQSDEHERATRYRRQDDRIRFVYGRAMAKAVIGKFTGQHATAIQFVSGVNNKPELAGITDFHFNLSHTANWILLAVSRSNVGIDVEKIITDFPFQDILQNSFGSEEQQYVKASANPVDAFYRLWTRKEALIKATAKGMDDDFSRIPSLDGDHITESDSIGKAGFWTVTSFSVADDYAAALAHPLAAEIPEFYTVGSGLLELC
ncbi:4'-phosphopantetheinyl transferase family protein [Spirosoma agri]|uniref:4'-phosphopantetheinyl transferase superfamily protein n=1 Tax=Spirosoma agri TaxID=1987381 RepID=A0A6M0ISK4_9BACT|nr:4'-phosphopantetheinyl transferase superfamily protein [Spirosoma agri]NEU70461.1 4'-phosphopantetheinyl transferase superfamily protein [Spirosoma agri]